VLRRQAGVPPTAEAVIRQRYLAVGQCEHAGGCRKQHGASKRSLAPLKVRGPCPGVRNFEIVSGELALTDGRISRSARESNAPPIWHCRIVMPLIAAISCNDRPDRY